MDIHTASALVFMMATALAVSYLNRERGDERKPDMLPKKWTVYLTMALVVSASLFVTHGDDLVYGQGVWPLKSLLIIPALFGLLWLSFSFGWGRYFPDGENYTKKGEPRFAEREFRPADWLTDRVVGRWDRVMPRDFVLRWQTVATSLRFFLTFGVTVFPFLCAASGQPLALLGSPAMLLVGPIYRAVVASTPAGADYVPPADYAVGAWLGAAMSLSYF